MTKIITNILDASAVQLVLPAKIAMLHPNPTNLTTAQNNLQQPNRVHLMAKTPPAEHQFTKRGTYMMKPPGEENHLP